MGTIFSHPFHALSIASTQAEGEHAKLEVLIGLLELGDWSGARELFVRLAAIQPLNSPRVVCALFTLVPDSIVCVVGRVWKNHVSTD